jgi:hypothetical protein
MQKVIAAVVYIGSTVSVSLLVIGICSLLLRWVAGILGLI